MKPQTRRDLLTVLIFALMLAGVILVLGAVMCTQSDGAEPTSKASAIMLEPEVWFSDVLLPEEYKISPGHYDGQEKRYLTWAEAMRKRAADRQAFLNFIPSEQHRYRLNLFKMVEAYEQLPDGADKERMFRICLLEFMFVTNRLDLDRVELYPKDMPGTARRALRDFQPK